MSKAGGTEAASAPSGIKLMPAIIGPPPDPSPADLIYRIGPFDNLRVDVFGVPEISADVQVNLQGLIVLPLVGPVMVDRMTPHEAEVKIAQELATHYLRDPKVTVNVKSSANLNVSISGYVNQGLHPITGRMTLSDMLAKVGGVQPTGKKRHVVLYRLKGRPGVASDGDYQAYVIDYQAILDGKLRDPLLVGYDKIYVPPSALALFFDPWISVFRTYATPAVRGGF